MSSNDLYNYYYAGAEMLGTNYLKGAAVRTHS